jgi:Transglutaminase-like superfamily
VAVIDDLRAAWWAARSVRRARAIPVGSITAGALPSVPPLPMSARRGVSLSLRLAKANCLVRAIVLQAWWLAHGEERDLVIGVTAPSKGFSAHAWLEGDPPCHTERFHELARRPARR